MKFLSQLSPSKIKNKCALVRVDFNVTLNKKGKILDDFRIRACLPTIQYLIKKRAKVIIISHLSKSQLSFKKNQKTSLKGIARYLSRLLKKKVLFFPACQGEKVKKRVELLKPGQILFLENLRFYPEEEKNDLKFSQELAGLADFYVNDGFAVSHRAHASVVGVTKYLPSFAGLLLEKEIKNLDRVLKKPTLPLLVIIGGAKVATKIKLIKNFLAKKADVLLGGVIANTLLNAKGLTLGKSLVDKEVIGELKKLNFYDNHLHLPVDVLTASSPESQKKPALRPPAKVGSQEMILDIGPDTISLFKIGIEQAKTIIWNGPMGYFEKKKFSEGTEAIAKAIASAKCFSLVGGGDTLIILQKLGLLNKYSFVSTGGGAMLEYLAGKKLPGIEALKRNKKNL